jgi:hypothetical protein
MSESSRLVALNAGCSGPLRCVVGVVVATIFVVSVAPPGTTKADRQQYSVVAQVDAKSEGLTSGEIVVRIGNISALATGIRASPAIPRSIAIVIDAGPDQANVLSKEKEMATALINELSDDSTSLTIVRAGTLSKTQATTLDRSVAIDHIRDIAGDSGEKTNVAIYDAIGSTFRQISLSPGLRVVIFIGEGNDGGSKLRYGELHSLADSSNIAFFAALVANHSLRGAKSILRYGWNLQELTSDTAGIFLENQTIPRATRRLSESVRGLRLIGFEAPSLQPGRYKISVSTRRGKRLRVEKTIVIP